MLQLIDIFDSINGGLVAACNSISEALIRGGKAVNGGRGAASRVGHRGKVAFGLLNIPAINGNAQTS